MNPLRFCPSQLFLLIPQSYSFFLSFFQEGVGKILNDLTGHRRASIRSVDTSSSGKDMLQRSIIFADVPLAELVGYATSLRSISSGEASLSMVLHGYRVSYEQ